MTPAERGPRSVPGCGPNRRATPPPVRAALLLLCASIVALGSAGPVEATDLGPELTVDPVRAEPGGILVVAAAGFAPGTTVTVYLGASPVGTAAADGAGTITVDVPLPDELTNLTGLPEGTPIPPPVTDGGERAAAPDQVAIMVAGSSSDGLVRSARRVLPAGWADSWVASSSAEDLRATSVGVALAILAAFLLAVGALVTRHRRLQDADDPVDLTPSDASAPISPGGAG